MAKLGAEQIGGLSQRQVRDLLRFCGPVFYAQRAALHLRCSLEKALGVTYALERAGLVSRFGVDRDGDIEWEQTLAAGRLRAARAGHRIKRVTAERLLEAVCQRAWEWNRAAPWMLEYVREIHVFGSFLQRDVERLGDLDLAIAPAHRPGQTGEDRVWDYNQFGLQPDQLTRFLRARSAYVSLQPLDSVRKLGTPLRLVFRARMKDVARYRRPW